jgi:hypothetical protein
MQETYRTEGLARYLTQHVAGIAAIAIPSQQRLAALRYLLSSKQAIPLDMLSYLEQTGVGALGKKIEHLYQTLGVHWWQTKERFRFPLWREYEFLLPPALEVEFSPEEPDLALRPLGSWAYLDDLDPDSTIELQDFTVESLYSVNNAVMLKAGKGDEAAYLGSRVMFKGLPDLKQYSQEKSIRSLRGKIRKTREDQLFESLKVLQPPFEGDQLELTSPLGNLPNPILALPSLLQYEVEGYLAQIHGNLRLENILVGDQTWLIHLDQTRVGHILFDWALLEASILQEVIAPLTDGEWASLWKIGAGLQAIHHMQQPDLMPTIAEALNTVQALREIVTPLLGQRSDWREYYAALVVVSLAQISALHHPIAARRLAFISAAVAAQLFQEVQFQQQSQIEVGIQLA